MGRLILLHSAFKNYAVSPDERRNITGVANTHTTILKILCCIVSIFQCKCQDCLRVPREEDGPIHQRNHKPMIFDDRPEEQRDDITLSDYYDFICNFIMTDNKGNVSNAHLAFADSEPDGKTSRLCQ